MKSQMIALLLMSFMACAGIFWLGYQDYWEHPYPHYYGVPGTPMGWCTMSDKEAQPMVGAVTYEGGHVEREPSKDRKCVELTTEDVTKQTMPPEPNGWQCKAKDLRLDGDTFYAVNGTINIPPVDSQGRYIRDDDVFQFDCKQNR